MEQNWGHSMIGLELFCLLKFHNFDFFTSNSILPRIETFRPNIHHIIDYDYFFQVFRVRIEMLNLCDFSRVKFYRSKKW